MRTNLRQNLKRALILVLCFCFIFAFAGCSANKGANQLESIQKAGKIVVGLEGTYPPFNYHDPESGELCGIDVEIALKIGEKLGVEVEFVEAAWESLLSGIDSGRLDVVINNVGITEARQEKYDFTDGYLYIPKQIVVKGDNEDIKSPEDLNGKKVATSATNAFNSWLESHGAEVIAVDTGEEAASLLLSGRADFVNFDPLILKSYMDEHPDADLKVAFVVTDTYETAAIPVRKGESELLGALNDALHGMSEDGTLSALSEKYTGGDYTEKP